MQHLEALTQNKALPQLDILCKNLLYCRVRTGSESVAGILRDPQSWERAGRVQVNSAQGFVEQLDLVRQFKKPNKNDFIFIAMFCQTVCDPMLKEAHTRGYFDQDPDEFVRLDKMIQEAAQADLDYIERFNDRSHLKKAINPDPTLNYAGSKTAKMTFEYVQAMDVSTRHIPYLMRTDSTLAKLLVVMQGLHTRRRQESQEEYRTVNRNHRLFVEDLTGARHNVANIVIDRGSLSTVNQNLTLNPSLQAMQGARTDAQGKPDPYVYAENFLGLGIPVTNAFIEVCLAFNLFGLTEVWFNEFPDKSWTDIDWKSFDEEQDGFAGMFEPDYGDRIHLTRDNFFILQHALAVVFRNEEEEDTSDDFTTEEYHEKSQEWAANARRRGTAADVVTYGGGYEEEASREMYGEGDYPGEAVVAEFYKKNDNTALMIAGAAAVVGGGALYYFA